MATIHGKMVFLTYTHEWLVVMVNVNKYTMDGSYGWKIQHASIQIFEKLYGYMRKFEQTPFFFLNGLVLGKYHVVF